MEWTDNDYAYAAFRNGTCVAIATVMDGTGADRYSREFYRDYAGCEIKIMPRAKACEALMRGAQGGHAADNKGAAQVTEMGEQTVSVWEERRRTQVDLILAEVEKLTANLRDVEGQTRERLAELELTLTRFMSNSPTLGDLSFREKLRSQFITDLLEQNAGLTRERDEALERVAELEKEQSG